MPGGGRTIGPGGYQYDPQTGLYTATPVAEGYDYSAFGEIAQSILDNIIFNPNTLITTLFPPFAAAADIPSSGYEGVPADGDGNGNGGGGGKNRFLLYTGAALAALTAGPALYSLYKGRKRGKKGQTGSDPTREALEASSARITQVIASAAPVLAFPVAYIGVEELENRGVISGKLGDDVQLLMSSLAIGSTLGPIGSIIKSVI